MGELTNCKNCGDVYVKTIRDICPNCYKEEETASQTVKNFLKDRRNRQATMAEIVAATSVEQELITKFIKERRLHPSEFPNIGYPCDRCGTMIQTGNFCTDCAEALRKEVAQQEGDEERWSKIREEEKHTSTYYAFDKNKK